MNNATTSLLSPAACLRAPEAQVLAPLTAPELEATLRVTPADEFEIPFVRPSPGAVRGGSLGVRGMLQLTFQAAGNAPFSAHTPHETEDALTRACTRLQGKNVRRVHAILDRCDETACKSFQRLNFSPCEGETFFERPLTRDHPIPAAALHAGYELRGASPADIAQLEQTISKVPELAILDWEWELVRGGLQCLTQQALVAEHDGQLVGALIGGHACGRGTIAHLWVDPVHRRHGIGRDLVLSSLARFRTANVNVVHVITTAGNDRANQFWSALGFGTAHGRMFLERDL